MTLSIWIQFNSLKTLQNTQTYLEQEREMQLSRNSPFIQSTRLLKPGRKCLSPLLTRWCSNPCQKFSSFIIYYFFRLTKYSTELYFNSDSICHFNFWSELEHKKIIAFLNGPIKKDHFFLISTFISLNHSRNIIIIVPFTENSYSPPRSHPGAPLYRCLFLLLLRVAGCSTAQFAIMHNQEKN